MNEDEYSNDEELAPMVDGLSGTLCVLILISTVFMISSTTKIFEEITGSFLKFEESVLNLDKNTVSFNEGLFLSPMQINDVSEKINSMNGDSIELNIFMPERIKNRYKKMVYNLLYFKSKIKVKKKLSMKMGTEEICKDNNSCIYWKVE